MEEANMSFENQWNAAFEGAEMSPSEHVWTSIDGVLANQQASGLKKRMLFFKWVAAASVSITVLAISALWVQNNNKTHLAESKIIDQETNSLAAIEPTENSIITNKTIVGSENSESTNNNELNNQNEHAANGDNGTIDLADNSFNGSALAIVEDETSNSIHQLTLKILDNKEERTSSESYLAVIHPQQSNIESLLTLDRPEQLYSVADPNALKNFEIVKDEFSLWAGVSMSTGTFNPNAGGNSGVVETSASLDGGSGTFSEVSNVLNNDETLNSGSSISAGLDLRGKVSKKIILSSGIHYLKNTSSLGSNVTVTDANSGESFAIRNSDIGNSTLSNGLTDGTFTVENSATNFNNGLEYLSIPLKAGYIVLDKKINITINSGISTSFLLDARLNNSDGETQLFNQDNSFSSSFEPVVFNFLSSVELGYTFKEKYFFSVEPNYSQALTDFAKSESNFSGKSNNFGISVGIKYNF